MTQPPSGTVTFLFTDIEGSTRRWEDDAGSMDDALGRHDALLRAAVEEHGGYVFATGGDGFAVAFARAGEAVSAAVAFQGVLREGSLLPVRIGIHTGAAIERDGDYFGPTVNRAARLMAVGHGGQILVSSATERLVSGVELRDLGEHRLRDLSTPERVFQVVGDDLERDFPPLRSLDAFATNLPVQTTAFVGRDTEVGDVAELVGEHRLVTLTGVGGVGKTRLAFQVGAEVLPRFDDGVFLIELGGVVDPDALGDVLATMLCVRVGQGESSTSAAVRHLGERRVLLLLDNCEHLIAAAAALVEEVLRGCRRCHVLATTREPLALAGEHIVAVTSLAVPDEHDRSSVEHAEAVRLLVDRARMARPDFRVTDENAAALGQICRRLDGIPLALELAAGRLRSMSAADVAARLDQRFRLLTGGTRSAANRHQTLRRTIDWSYNLLDDAERRVLQRAAVFASGFRLDAAEAVCASDDIDAFDVVDLLAHLVDKSLLTLDETETSTRYRMLETIRDYGLERLEQDAADVDEVRVAHARYYARFAAEASEGLRSRDEREWLHRVLRELDNLRAAVIWSLDSANPDVAYDIIAPLAIEMLRTDHVVGGWAESAVRVDGVEAHPRYAQVAAFAAYSAMRRGDMESAARLRAVARAAIPPGTEGVQTLVRVLASEMIVTMAIEGPEAWARTGEERVSAARAAGDPYELTRALAQCAVALSSTGYDSRDLAHEALELGRRLGNPSTWCGAAMAYGNVVAVHDPVAALDAVDEALRAAEAAGNDALAEVTKGVRGYVLYRIGKTKRALTAILDSMDAQIAQGYVSYAFAYTRFIAAALAAVDRPEPAAALLGYWSENWQSYAYTSDFPEEELDSLRTLRHVLGDARYDELLAQGASLDTPEAMAFARTAIEALTDD